MRMTDHADRILGELLRLALATRGLGSPLAAERSLATQLGTSRASLGHGLAVLRRWGILEARRGSGVKVRPRGTWSLGALPGLVALEGLDRADSLEVRSLAAEALALRRALARQLPTHLPRALEVGALDPGREAAEVAWAGRQDIARFVEGDGRVAAAALEAGGARAAAWSWNDLTGVAIALARRRGARVAIPDDYLEQQSELLAALERGQGRRASRILATHLGRLDRQLLHSLPTAAPGAG
jgi:DNA-binding FadR family transcriptional regulator